jgi:uncharacterized membrane protein
MELLFKIFLVLHIIGGMSALLCGLAAIVAPKGKRVHRLCGQVFVYGMMTVAVSAVYLGIAHWSQFLLHIAVFSFTLTYAGWRSTRNKSMRPSPFDWLVMAMGLVNGVWMVATLNTVLIVFGLIQGMNAANDLRMFLRLRRKLPLAPKAWLLRHIGSMLGAYIATATAFIVVNVRDVEPAWLPWLLPTVLGTPLIAYWSRRVRLQAQARGAAARA